MEQYIKKSTVVAEIERIKKEECPIDSYEGRCKMLWFEQFLTFLNTLEVKDMDEEIKNAEDHAYFAGSETMRVKLIDKACKWLASHINDYLVKGRDIDYLFEDFRKAMEDE